MHRTEKRAYRFSSIGIGIVLAATALAELPMPEPSTTPPPHVIRVPAPTDASTPSSVTPTGGMDVVVFLNGDRLQGRLVSANPAGYGLRWKHPCAVRDMEFALQGISSVKLAPRGESRTLPPGALIELTNGDILTGQIAGLDNEKLMVDTWYAGRLNIRRFMARRIKPGAIQEQVVYEGPNNLEEWSFPARERARAAWQFRNGTLYALQVFPIGRVIENMPDAVDIELQISFSRYPELTFAFFTDNIQNYYGNCYMLQLSGNTVQAFRCSRSGDQTSLGRAELRGHVNQGGRCRFNILADRVRRTFALLVNGTLVHQWNDSGGLVGSGKGLFIQPQNPANLRIHRLRVSGWNGKLPSASTLPMGTSQEDSVVFANGDRISGTVKTIADGRLWLETSYRPLEIPLERIGEIAFATERSERARRFEWDVQAHFAHSGVITLRLDAVEGDRLMGFSENFGSATLPLNAFNLLRFNLYRDALPEGNPAGHNTEELLDGVERENLRFDFDVEE